MSLIANRPTLHVEGKNDKFTIAELVRRHGVDMSEATRPFEILTSDGAGPNKAGIDSLLESMADAIRNATDRPIGFVVDVDVKTADRWQAICARLREAGLAPPSACPANGYFGKIPHYPHKVGVWLMPDCVMDHGKLEHLLKTLVPADDVLWPLAEKVVGDARQLGAAFADTDVDKAVLHSWLAWQREPGVPYGTAINAKFFDHDSQEAIAFLRWLSGLFNIGQLDGLQARQDTTGSMQM